MTYNNYDIGNKLETLRKKHHYSQEKLMEILSSKYGFKMDRGNYGKIERGLYPVKSISLGLLMALSDLYSCEIGYLLCEYECETGRNTDINAVTGLNDKSIKGLELIQSQDENENSITIVPKKVMDKLNSNTCSDDEKQRLIEYYMFDNPTIKKTANKRPTLMDLFNFIVGNGYMEQMLFHFRNLINARYKVPVFFDNDKNTFIYPDNDYSCMRGLFGCSDIYTVNLASSQDNPNDNAPLCITDNFIQSVALKDIEDLFKEMKKAYNEEK